MKATDETRAFGNRVREIRTSLHLSQEEFAAEIGCCKNTVSRYETGETKMDVFTMMGIIERFQLDLADFFPAHNCKKDSSWEKIAFEAGRLKPEHETVVKQSTITMIEGLKQAEKEMEC